MSIRVAGRGFSRSPSILFHDETLAAAGRFDVTGIPPSYNTIEGYIKLRTDIVGTLDGLYLLLNGDSTATNYRVATRTSGSSDTSSVSDEPLAALVTGNGSTADYFSVVRFFINDYVGGHNKMVQCFGVDRETATVIYNTVYMFQWENTAVVNQITLQPDGYATDEFLANSRLQVWLHR